MELATIFCLTEIGREKGGGLISKKPPEEVAFVTEACYPFWLVPLGRRTLLFDGFGIISHTISFDILPDAGVFIHEVKGSEDKLEAYSAFLSHNRNYFSGFSGKGQKTIKGLIMDLAFTKDFVSLLPKAKRVKGSIPDRMLLSPLMDESAVKASVKELTNLRNALKEDVENLRNIVKMLVGATQKHINAIDKEIEDTNRKSEIEIAHFKSDSMKKVEEIRREYDEKIVRISEETSRLIQDFSQERVRLELDEKRLTTYAERCETEMSSARIRGDEAEEERWKQELEKCRQELSETSKKLEEVNKSLENAEPARDMEISRLKSEYTSHTETIMSDLKRIEAARDAKIQMDQQALKSLEETTSAIISQINRLIELRNHALEEVSKIGEPMIKRKYSLMYLPFFLVCNKQDLKKRYIVFPPSRANTMSGVTKIKGALRSFKVRMLLQDLSMPMTNLLNRFVNLIEQNSMFEDRVANACAKTNILKSRSLRKDVAEGLKELLAEGWLSEEELRVFNERLEKTSP